MSMNVHITDKVNFSNFGIPSWRIEQRFAPGVLIGNWSEERHKFSTDKYKHNTTNRMDFRNFGGAHPDVTARRKAKLGNEGIPYERLFQHHDRQYNDMKITLYDENFNGRYKEKCLPALRDWDSQALGWLPERTDHPLKGAPTNFGLKEKKQKEEANRLKDLYHPELESTYQGSYKEQNRGAMCFDRYATPKALSAHLLPTNKINNDLHLRGKQTLRLPEIMPKEMTQGSI